MYTNDIFKSWCMWNIAFIMEDPVGPFDIKYWSTSKQMWNWKLSLQSVFSLRRDILRLTFYAVFILYQDRQINTYTLHWKCRFFSRIDWIQLKNERIYPFLGTFLIYPKYLYREVPRCFGIFGQIWSRISNDSSNFIWLIISISMLNYDLYNLFYYKSIDLTCITFACT